MLAGLPNPFTATRYHSLAVEPATVPAEWDVTGKTASGVIMAMKHRSLAVEGVQFHPESVLTEGGHLMLANWLAVCGDPDAVERSRGWPRSSRPLTQPAHPPRTGAVSHQRAATDRSSVCTHAPTTDRLWIDGCR